MTHRGQCAAYDLDVPTFSARSNRVRTAVVQALFVLSWSTGFVTARYATKDNGPLTFVSIRLLLAGLILAAIARARAMAWPPRHTWRSIATTGVLMNTFYLGSVWVAVHEGMTSNLSASISGIHPIITAVAAAVVLGESLRRRQVIGVTIGFVGVAFVLIDRLRDQRIVVPTVSLVLMVIAVSGICMGTLVQRARNTSMPLLTGSSLQFLVSGIVLAALAGVFEHRAIHVNSRFVGAMFWAVGVLSVTATLAMNWLISNNAAATVSSLFFVTPALSVLESWVIFGEHLGWLAILGLACAAVAVRLVTMSAKPVPVVVAEFVAQG
jgi:drug/metabolite transporter (DMT)-like permease